VPQFYIVKVILLHYYIIYLMRSYAVQLYYDSYVWTLMKK